MKKIAFVLVPLMGVALAKAEALAEQKTQITQVTTLGPGKNYRAKLAKQYFGRGGSRCHKWNRFCGR